jgi:hypothetical protein
MLQTQACLLESWSLLMNWKVGCALGERESDGGGVEGECHLAYDKESGSSDLHRIRQITVTTGHIFVRQTQLADYWTVENER